MSDELLDFMEADTQSGAKHRKVQVLAVKLLELSERLQLVAVSNRLQLFHYE